MVVMIMKIIRASNYNNMSSGATVKTRNKGSRPLIERKYCHPVDFKQALMIVGKRMAVLP